MAATAAPSDMDGYRFRVPVRIPTRSSGYEVNRDKGNSHSNSSRSSSGNETDVILAKLIAH